MSRWWLLVCVAAAGCSVPSLLPQGPDGGAHLVPDSYHGTRNTPGHRAHLAVTGEKQLRCHDCHQLQEGVFKGVSLSVCVDCHKDEQKQHHVDAGVTSVDGGTNAMTCLSCHPFKPAEDAIRFERWTCLNCHARQQGTHAPITVHTTRCESCHKPHSAPFTQPADCTTCHDISLQHGAKGTSIADTCMKCHEHHTPAKNATGVCVDCHTKPTMEASARVSPQTLFSPGHDSCGTCHAPHAFTKSQVATCTTCHKDVQRLAPESHESCTTCHEPHTSRASPKACVSCHKDQKVTHPVDAKGQTCMGCHPPHSKTMPTSEVAQTCTTCHAKAPFTGEVVHASSLLCDSCHEPHNKKPSREPLCSKCHTPEVKATKVNGSHAKCDSCHANLPHGEPGEPPACLTCHKDKLPPMAAHSQGKMSCASCHDRHEANVKTTCASCHESKGLPGLHAQAKHADCKSCHAPHTPTPDANGVKMCMACHKTLPKKDHPQNPTQCVGCHLFKDVRPNVAPPPAK